MEPITFFLLPSYVEPQNLFLKDHMNGDFFAISASDPDEGTCCNVPLHTSCTPMVKIFPLDLAEIILSPIRTHIFRQYVVADHMPQSEMVFLPNICIMLRRHRILHFISPIDLQSNRNCNRALPVFCRPEIRQFRPLAYWDYLSVLYLSHIAFGWGTLFRAE